VFHLAASTAIDTGYLERADLRAVDDALTSVWDEMVKESLVHLLTSQLPKFDSAV
jgi:hypothetical protein